MHGAKVADLQHKNNRAALGDLVLAPTRHGLTRPLIQRTASLFLTLYLGGYSLALWASVWVILVCSGRFYAGYWIWTSENSTSTHSGEYACRCRSGLRNSALPGAETDHFRGLFFLLQSAAASEWNPRREA